MKTTVRLGLAAILLVAGVAHFANTEEFYGQLPDWLPGQEFIVLASGVVEIALGLALIATPARHRPLLGWIVAGFFLAVFPGNIWQLIDGSDSFGLDSTLARVIRLPFQPLLILGAVWSTGALRGVMDRRRGV